MAFIAALFRPAQPIPREYRSNFIHLFFDSAWYGILSGSAMAFIAIYAARLGASPEEIGLINASPALVNILFALPAGRWLEQHPVSKSVFWSAILSRVFYAIWIPLPWLFSNQSQIRWIIITTLLMSVPGTVLAVGFNALFAESVPNEWRGHVVGIRNALLSVTTVITSILCGKILGNSELSTGYPIVFGLGLAGALLSSLHLYFIKTAQDSPRPTLSRQAILIDGIPRKVEELKLKHWNKTDTAILPKLDRGPLVRLEILKSPFGRIILLLFFFYLGVYFPAPLFPLYTVNVLHFNDWIFSLGTAMFNLTMFLSSLQLARLTHRMGNKFITGIGAVMMGIYPFLMAISHSVGMYMTFSFIGGIASSLATGALFNYMLENVPVDDRPAHLAWYNLAMNSAILIGSLGGSAVTGILSLPAALLLFAVVRFIAGAAILRWG